MEIYAYACIHFNVNITTHSIHIQFSSVQFKFVAFQCNRIFKFIFEIVECTKLILSSGFSCFVCGTFYLTNDLELLIICNICMMFRHIVAALEQRSHKLKYAQCAEKVRERASEKENYKCTHTSRSYIHTQTQTIGYIVHVT